MRPFERVHTVMDYYDGPRAGFADFDGAPHAYRSIWREDLDDWDPDDRFALKLVTPETLALALEDWAIWGRWDTAYHAGKTSVSEHPALPADQPRHSELAPIIAQTLELDPARCRIAVGEFRRRDNQPGRLPMAMSRMELEVRWTPVEPLTDPQSNVR